MCGSRGPTLKNLALECKTPGYYGRTNLSYIDKGKLPIGLDQWPDEDPIVPPPVPSASSQVGEEPTLIHYPNNSKHELDPNDRVDFSSTSSMPIEFLPSLHSKVQYEMYQGDPTIDPIDPTDYPNLPNVPLHASSSSSSHVAPLSPINPEETLALANLDKQILEIAKQQSLESIDEDELLRLQLNTSFP